MTNKIFFLFGVLKAIKIYVEFDRDLVDNERSVKSYSADQRGNMTGEIIHQVKKMVFCLFYDYCV